ncbi:MAG: phasin family protein [Alphaproteobacteria bacterium]|nr:phasin family protein [Alphaproteobacteria bacterium]
MSLKFENIYNRNFIKNFSDLQTFQFPDVTPLFEVQKRNLEVCAEAGNLVLKGLQSAGKCQSEFFSRMLEESSSMVKVIVAEDVPEQKVAKQAVLVQKCYENSVANWQQLAEILNRSGNEAANIIQKHAVSSMEEYKGILNRIEDPTKLDTERKIA